MRHVVVPIDATATALWNSPGNSPDCLLGLRGFPSQRSGQPKNRGRAKIGASKAGLRSVLSRSSRSSPMNNSGLKFC